MRLWVGGPRLFGLRTGVSFGPEDLRRARPHAATPPTQVYVIAGDHGHSKVGISRDPLARLSQLQTGSPARLRIAAVATYDQAREVEAAAHALLQRYRLSGEWFDCSPEIALAAVTAAAAHIGAALCGNGPPQARYGAHAHVMRFIGLGLIGLASAAFASFIVVLIRLTYG